MIMINGRYQQGPLHYKTVIDDKPQSCKNNKNAVDASVPTQLADDKSLNDAAAALVEVATWMRRAPKVT